MMMLPEGWVTDVINNRAAALRMLGNGVVPLAGAVACADLLGSVLPATNPAKV